MEEEVKGEENSKVEKKFGSAMAKLMTVIKGDESLLKKVKVGSSDIDIIVADLTRERKETATKLFKGKLVEILDKYVVFESETKRAEQELKNTILKKKEEFTKQINECFGMIDNIDKLQQDYVNALKIGTQSTASDAEQE